MTAITGPKLRKVAALFVSQTGIYSCLPAVDCWGIERDARRYRGPHSVVAHPPCQRWGRYWHGGPSAKQRRILGDDEGCFAAALWAARTFGGVIEHPEASHAWRWHGLVKPPIDGGWVPADYLGGSTCCVEQGHYGHPARKKTWLYAIHVPELPELRWGSCTDRARLDQGFHSAEERRQAKRKAPRTRIPSHAIEATPPAFAEVLVKIARNVSK